MPQSEAEAEAEARTQRVAKVCAWCRAALETTHEPPRGLDELNYGMCSSCIRLSLARLSAREREAEAAAEFAAELTA